MVRDWFFPSHAKHDVFDTTTAPTSARGVRQRAVDKVNLWLFKAGQLHPAVVATASLTEALLHDDGRRTSSDRTISDSAMQSIYAMAFARFVNAFVDRDVARSQVAGLAFQDSDGTEDASTPAAGSAKGESSMYAHATAIGMPQQFVDLRHQVAHADIPNLMYLRKMTEQGLAWLWEKWWVKNATGSPERALRENEHRRGVCQQAREARESAEEADQESAQGRSNGHGSDLILEGTMEGPVPKLTSSSYLDRTTITPKKRRIEA